MYLTMQAFCFPWEASERLLTPAVLDEFGNHVSNLPCLRDVRDVREDGEQQRRQDGKGGPKPVPKSKGQGSAKIHV